MRTDRFTVRDGSIYFGSKLLGPSDQIIVDYNELVGVDTVTHVTMPRRIDGVMAVEGKVVGIESKRPDDLLNSFLSRRLKRQLVTLRETVDLPVLLLRGEIPTLTTYNAGREKVTWDRAGLTPLFEELARWQMLGAVVLHGPENPADVPPFLLSMQKVLSGGRNVLVAVAGTDQKPDRERRPGWLLRRIPGIGAKTSVTLHKAAGSTLIALSASPERLYEWGMNKAVVKAIQEAIK